MPIDSIVQSILKQCTGLKKYLMHDSIVDSGVSLRLSLGGAQMIIPGNNGILNYYHARCH